MPDGIKEPLWAGNWEISEDGTDYTLHFFQDVTFHDQNSMTAEDVAFSLDTAASTASGKTLLINYDNIKVIDEYTGVVHLTTPYGPFLNSFDSREGNCLMRWARMVSMTRRSGQVLINSRTGLPMIVLTIKRGETLGVVGEFGCVKSTLGRIILRRLKPTSGEIRYRGNNIVDYSRCQMKETRILSLAAVFAFRC